MEFYGIVGLLVWSLSCIDGQYTVTIVSTPAGTLVSGSNNKFDYPILSSVTLTCMVDPSPPAGATYQWNTTGCFINDRHHTPTCFPYDQTAQSVTGYDLTAEDAGSITCTVTTGGVNYTSGSLTIRISGIAVTGASNITTDLVSSNQITDYSFVTQPFTLDPFMVILRCATGLGPSGSDRNIDLGGWYFNGVQLFTPFSNYYYCSGSVFEIRGANGRRYPGVVNFYLCGTFTTTEEGVYSCILMNSSMMNHTMRVGVYFSGRTAPMMIRPPSSTVTVVAGFPLTLSCTSRGSPPDTFTWRKDSGPIVQSISITTVTHTNTSAVFRADYSINSVTTSDSGTYTCTVTNPIGNDSETITVKVVVPTPNVIVTAPNTQIDGRSSILECSATTVGGITSRVDIIWRKDGTELKRMLGVNVSFTVDHSTVYTGTYTISKLITTDDGREYQCELLINTSPPVIATGSVILNVLAHCPTLNAPSNGTLSCIIKVDGVPSSGDTCSIMCNGSLVIVRGTAVRTCSTDGSWTGVENVCGAGSPPLIAPQNFTSTNTTPSSITFKWIPLADQEVSGMVMWYIIICNESIVTNVTGNNTAAVVTGLHSFTEYSCTIHAVTVADGPISDPVLVKTAEEVMAPVVMADTATESTVVDENRRLFIILISLLAVLVVIIIALIVSNIFLVVRLKKASIVPPDTTANDYDYVKALKSKKNKQEISEAKIYENTSTVSSTESKENNPELQENPAYCNIADHEYSNVVRQ